MKSNDPPATGRPPKSPSALRHKKVTAAFTESEYNRLVQQSEQSRIKLSKLVSQLAVEGQVISKFSDEERRTITELRKFYNSVNQLNKSLNYFKNNLSSFDSKKQTQRLNEVLTLVDSLLG